MSLFECACGCQIIHCPFSGGSINVVIGGRGCVDREQAIRHRASTALHYYGARGDAAHAHIAPAGDFQMRIRDPLLITCILVVRTIKSESGSARQNIIIYTSHFALLRVLMMAFFALRIYVGTLN